MTEGPGAERNNNVALISLICPNCRKYVSSIVANGGPVLVRHVNRFQPSIGTGPWQTCRARWVVIPDPTAGKLRLRRVSGFNEPDLVLREEAELWQGAAL